MTQTRQRTEVLDALRSGEAFAAQELHDHLRATGSHTGLATVYRILRRLADEGTVDVIREDPVQARYRLCSTEHHHHLLCESCGKVIEIPECDIESWAKKVARKQRFVVRTHRAEILGLCSGCAPRR
jgi:Fur family transcriptional regulator, ferric uptake regulator